MTDHSSGTVQVQGAQELETSMHVSTLMILSHDNEESHVIDEFISFPPHLILYFLYQTSSISRIFVLVCSAIIDTKVGFRLISIF